MSIKKAKLGIFDYSLGNLLSVCNAVEFLGYKAVVSNEFQKLKNCDGLILPGVGAFGKAMQILRSRNHDELLEELVIGYRKPILGICLGMQLFASKSEEGNNIPGLNWIQGNVVKLKHSKNNFVPNVGWSNIKVLSRNPLYVKLSFGQMFYFDHSYHYECNKKYITAVINNKTPIIASIQKGNIFGVQFHPEKSQKNGLKLLRGFVESI